jgi:hypothetical protein
MSRAFCVFYPKFALDPAQITTALAGLAAVAFASAAKAAMTGWWTAGAGAMPISKLVCAGRA